MPDIVPGIDGNVVTDIGNVRLLLMPHELLEDTDTVPPIELAVAVIELVEEDPDQPDGSDHV